MTDDDSRSMVFSSWRSKDKRDSNSFYAITSSETSKGMVFLFDVKDEGLLIQAAENRASYSVGNGMCVPTVCVPMNASVYAFCPGCAVLQEHDRHSLHMWADPALEQRPLNGCSGFHGSAC